MELAGTVAEEDDLSGTIVEEPGGSAVTTIVRGAVKTLRFTITEKASGNAIDLTGLPILIEFRDWNDDSLDLSKTEADVTLDTQSGATLGQFTLTLSTTETAEFGPRLLNCGVFVTYSGEKRRAIHERFSVDG